MSDAELRKLLPVIREMPVRGRVAFCISCFQNLLDSAGIDNEWSQQTLEWMWSYVGRTDLGEWEGEIRAKTFILGSASDAEAKIGKDNGKFDLNTLYPAVFLVSESILDCGCAHLYSAFESAASEPIVIGVLRELSKLGVSIPDPKRFRMPYSEDREFGDGVNPPQYRAWCRGVAPKEPR